MIQSKRDKTQNSNKLHLDKYYTSPELAKYVVDKTKEIIGEENITQWLEPSAGNGVFLPHLENYLAYDIEPDADGIIKQDYLTLDLPYKKGRCVIGNPPYGSRLNLAKAFCNKSFDIADYVAFILPVSQYNNEQSIYKFDLVYTENLGVKMYSDEKVHCCLNIYKRPTTGFNKRKNYRNSEIIDIIEIRETVKSDNPKRNRVLGEFDYDFAINAWGGGFGKNLTIGREAYEGQYVKMFYIKIKNGNIRIKDAILSAQWDELYPMTATPNLLQWQVYKFVEEFVKNYNLHNIQH